MGFASDWMDSAREVITSPSEYFESEERRDGFGYPLKFAALSFLLIGIFRAVSSVIAGSTGAAVSSLISGTIGGIVGMFIGAALVHIFVMLLGGDNGYSETLAALAYTTAVTVLSSALGIIPVVGGLAGLVLGIYGIYVQIKAVEKFQGMSTGRAAAAVILPAIVLAAVVVVLLTTVLAGAVSLGALSAVGA